MVFRDRGPIRSKLTLFEFPAQVGSRPVWFFSSAARRCPVWVCRLLYVEGVGLKLRFPHFNRKLFSGAIGVAVSVPSPVF